MSCRHEKPQRVGVAEWCPACGAYRVMVDWRVPELARDLPDMGALTLAVLVLENAIADYREDRDETDRLERVANWLANLPS